MKNYNTQCQDIYIAKRAICHFASKLSVGMQKPNQNFAMLQNELCCIFEIQKAQFEASFKRYTF